jgi:hypothetical protein
MALIKGKQLVAGTIDTRELKDNSVKLAKINDGEITSAKLNISGETWDFSGAGSFSVPAPTADAHSATKGYVDSVAQGLDVKESVRAATSSSGDFAGFAYNSGSLKLVESSPTQSLLSVGGVSLALNDRVLVKDQSTGTENGIYYVSQVGNGSTVAWELTRSLDADSSADITAGLFCFVEEGDAADSGFVLTTNDDITLDSTALSFSQFSGAGQITAGDGLAKSGDTMSIDLVNSASGLKFTSGELELDIDANGGLEVNTSLKIKAADDSINLDSNGLRVAVPVTDDQGQSVASNISTDDTDTGLTISNTPAGDGLVMVMINGIKAELGSGVKTADCYFSGDSGSTARAIGDIASGDSLYWNGASIFTLETSDVIDFIYNAV